jgi:hypothetical protein
MNLKSASRDQVLRYSAVEHMASRAPYLGSPPCQLWLKCMNNTRRSVSALLRRQTIPSSVLCCSSSQVSGGRTRKHCCALRKARRVVHLPRCGETSVKWGQSTRRIVRAAGDAKDHERVGLTFVPTHQDGTAISAFAFDRRTRRFQQHRRRLGHSFNDKRRRNDLEGLLWEHGCHQFQTRNST